MPTPPETRGTRARETAAESETGTFATPGQLTRHGRSKDDGTPRADERRIPTHEPVTPKRTALERLWRKLRETGTPERRIRHRVRAEPSCAAISSAHSPDHPAFSAPPSMPTLRRRKTAPRRTGSGSTRAMPPHPPHPRLLAPVEHHRGNENRPHPPRNRLSELSGAPSRLTGDSDSATGQFRSVHVHTAGVAGVYSDPVRDSARIEKGGASWPVFISHFSRCPRWPDSWDAPEPRAAPRPME